MTDYKPERKIGVGVVTYKRQDFFERVTESIPKDKLHFLCAVNDGSPYYTDAQEKYDVYIQHIENQGVGAAKNSAMQALIGMGCDHLFIMEDDILIKDPNVFDEYIDAASVSGLWHFNFEKVGDNKNQIMYRYEYVKDVTADGYGKIVPVTFHRNPQGAFSYMLASAVKNVGQFDENFKNAFEHIDFTYRFIKKGLLPPFWYFPDLQNSEDFLESIGEGDVSTITNREGYQENWNEGAKYFISKHGHFTNKIPLADKPLVRAEIERIKKQYAHEA